MSFRIVVGFVAGMAVTLVWTAFQRKSIPQSLRATLSLSKETILSWRRGLTCKALSISYENTDPLLIVRGKGQYLYDDAGREFLDTRNNVGHVGHTHPEVVRAISFQAAKISTNTRYLHPNLVLLAQKLLATFPQGSLLSDGRVFFVNSGSEANDLALRLAFAHTQKKEVIVVDRAYHGHTVSVIQISPYKFEHPRSVGQMPWVHKVPCPDIYRGEHQGPDASVHYSDYVKRACQQTKEGVAAFIVESGMSVAGVILPPEGYLKQCYSHVRAGGGVCIADEVQTGLGRFGRYWWGFEEQGVCPDIVTLGKPFGNGVALACVVCSRDISESFALGPEYFNTFGGNPVACAAGLAVMYVIENENLRDHATDVGDYLKEQLRILMTQTPPSGVDRRFGRALVGDVRGSGLFIGIEFVRDLWTKEAAAEEVSWICSQLKEEVQEGRGARVCLNALQHSILTSIDGPLHNVLVLKPPMCFSRANADTLIAALRRQIIRCSETDLSHAKHTPT